MQTFSLICWAFFVAIGFSGWGIIGNYSGASAAWVGSSIMVGGGVIVSLINAKQLFSEPAPGLRPLLILLFAIILNSVAVYIFASKVNMLKSAVTGMTAGAFVAIVNILMFVAALLLDFVLNGKSISISQMASIGTAVLTIFLASR
jgi:hypothetical protein